MLQPLWPTQDHNLRFVEVMFRVARAGELVKVCVCVCVLCVCVCVCVCIHVYIYMYMYIYELA